MKAPLRSNIKCLPNRYDLTAVTFALDISLNTHADLVSIQDAIAYHVRGWGHLVRRTKRKQDLDREVHSLKNRYLVMLKNEAGWEFLRDLPWILSFEAAQLGLLMLRQPRILAGFLGLWRAAPESHRRRHLGRLPNPPMLQDWFGYV
jgi:hypothetical protein